MNAPLKASLCDDVAAEVRAHLARQRLSGRRAALALGWTQPYMSRRLNGEVPFDVADLEAIAGLLGIPVVDLFQGPPRPETSPGVSSRRSWTPLTLTYSLAA